MNRFNFTITHKTISDIEQFRLNAEATWDLKDKQTPLKRLDEEGISLTGSEKTIKDYICLICNGRQFEWAAASMNVTYFQVSMLGTEVLGLRSQFQSGHLHVMQCCQDF